MISVIISVFLGLVGLMLLVLIHEWGHFVCARMAGIRVEVFSIGFGPKLWKKEVGGVEYALSAIPLGGYCKMAGETLIEGQQPDPGDMYYGRPWRRILAVLGGPLFSFLGAWAFFILASPLPRMVDNTPARVVVQSDILPETKGKNFGFIDGDIITAVNDEPVQRFEQVYRKIIASAKRELIFDVQREGKSVQIKAIPMLLSDGQGFLPIMPWYRPVIDDLLPGESAHKAGILVGDEILSVDGQSIENTAQLSRLIGVSNKPLDMRIRRGQEELDLTVTPAYNAQRKRYTIGVMLGYHSLEMVKGTNILQAIPEGSAVFVQSVQLYMRSFATLFQGVNPLRMLSGPVQNTYIIGEVAKTSVSTDTQGRHSWSLYNILTLLAFINLALGIMNLLPVPLLDGGLLLLYMIEAIRSKYLSAQAMRLYQMIGLSFIVLLFVLALGSDIFFILRK